MKIVKSFLPVALFLCCSTSLQAQQSKTATPPQPKADIEKPGDAKYPATDKPVAAPAISSGTTDSKQEAPDKLEAKTLNKNDISHPGGEQGAKIMAGKATPQADTVYSPSTVDPKPAPPVNKGTANKQQLQ